MHIYSLHWFCAQEVPDNSRQAHSRNSPKIAAAISMKQEKTTRWTIQKQAAVRDGRTKYPAYESA